MADINIMSMFDITKLELPMLITAIFGIVVFVFLVVLGIGAIDNINGEAGALSIISAVFYGAAIFIASCVCSDFELFQKLSDANNLGAVVIMFLSLVCIIGMPILLIVTVNVLDVERKALRVIFFIVLAYVFYFGLERYEVTADYVFLSPVASGLIFQLSALFGKGATVYISRISLSVLLVVVIIALIVLFAVFGLPYIIDLINNQNNEQLNTSAFFRNIWLAVKNAFTAMNIAQWITILAVLIAVGVGIYRINNEYGKNKLIAIFMLPIAIVYGCIFFLTFDGVLFLYSVWMPIFAFVCMLITVLSHKIVEGWNFLASCVLTLMQLVITVPAWFILTYLHSTAPEGDNMFLYVLQFIVFAIAFISQILAFCEFKGGSDEYNPVIDMTGDEVFIDDTPDGTGI